jgi:Crp-like helix-turn-helix protein
MSQSGPVQTEIGNNLLRRIGAEDFEAVRPHLRPFFGPIDSILYSPGDDVATVYFPRGATLVSFIVSTEDGSAVETMLVGREGAVGGIVSQGKLPAYTKIVVQHAGSFLTIPVATLDSIKTRSRRLENLFSRYADCMLAQIFQATACNAAHSIEQRLAKWITAAIDRTGDSTVPLTQERLAGMLGVGRSYASRLIQGFKEDEILRVERGRLIVIDIGRLRAKACLCDMAVKAHFDMVLQGVYPKEFD